MTMLVLAAVLAALLAAGWWRQHQKNQQLLARLQQQERLFRGVFDRQFHFVGVLSPQGRVLQISEPLEMPQLDPGTALVPKEAIIGALFWETQWVKGFPDEREAWPERLRQVCNMEQPLIFVAEGTSRYGHRIHVKVSITAVRDEQQQLEAYVLHAQDITGALRDETNLRETHAALEKQARLLTTTLGSISQGIFMLGEDGRVSTFNLRVCELLDLTPEYLQSRPTLADITRYQLQRGDFGEQASWVDDRARAYVAAAGQGPVPEHYLRTSRDGCVLEVRTQAVPSGGFVRTFTDVTDYVKAEEARKRTSALLNATQAIAGVGGWEVDLPSGKVFWTDALYRILDSAPGEQPPTLDDTLQFFPEPWRSAVRDAVDNLNGQAQPLDLELEMRTTQGRRIWVHAKSELQLVQGRAVKYTAVIQDITASKQAEIALREQDALWKLALESTGDGVWDWNIQAGTEIFSSRCLEMYGFTVGELAERPDALDARTHPDDVEQMGRDRQAHFDGITPTYVNEHRILCKDGSWKWIMSRGMLISRDEQGRPLRMIGTHTDITHRKQAEALIWQQANFDALTGLPNRRMLRDRLDQDLKKSRREGLKLAVIFIDLDHFKEVNDTLGHDQGDSLLIEAATRIRQCVRETDTVARMGGDEFTVIVPCVADMTRVERIVHTLLRTMEGAFKLGDEEAFVSASIGITVFPDDGAEIDDLLKQADQALYLAKDSGRNRFCYFTPALQASAQVRSRLANDLRLALPQGQFWVAYQPIVELATGVVHKAEALLRWQHPQRGLISPADFIPVAESSGLIVPIGDWVFAQAIQQVRAWRRDHHPDFQISVNKSPVQFHSRRDTQVSWFGQLQALGLPGNSVVVEITEGLLLDTSPGVQQQLQDFRQAGVGLSLDDFGTGYSSLAYLQNYDINVLKIDQSFVRRLTPASKDLGICKAIIVMAHELGLKVVAEGVETAQQRDLLLAAGCDYGQGYLFARPMPAATFEAFLGRGQ